MSTAHLAGWHDNTRTWADGFGVWHCEVTAPAPGNRRTARAAASAAIASEIRARNPRDILTGLTFAGERVVDGALIVTHYREEDGT